jgi:hypothetical protein
MHLKTDMGAEVLAAEAQRYLGVVDAFRREGCKPQWVAEPMRPLRNAVRPSPVLMTRRQT